MKEFHDAKYPTRPVRVALATHRMLRVAAAELGRPLGALADELLADELIRRRERDKIAVATAPTPPVATRG